MHRRIHRSLVDAVVDILSEVMTQNRYADRVIEKNLASDKRRGARDRAFIAENVYDIVRWWRYLGFLADVEYDMKKDAVWKRVALWLYMKRLDLPEWLEEHLPNLYMVETRKDEAVDIRVLRESMPDWLDDLCLTQLGIEKWEVEIAALNHQAELVVRVNTLKATAEEIQAKLKETEIQSRLVPGLPDALIIEKRMNLFALPEFKTGKFEVQDASSQHVAQFLNPEPGMRVIDACAGAGGKTLHLAALTKGKGRIVSMDVVQFKLDELKLRARRAGVSNIDTRLIESSKTIKRLYDSADRLLLDVPCSGTGVLRRNPDAKWKLSPDFITDVTTIQADILQSYPNMLKVGGIMVYATCSILPAENELQVKKFLTEHPNFELLEDKHLWPSDGFDGFYMARIRKNA